MFTCINDDFTMKSHLTDIDALGSKKNNFILMLLHRKCIKFVGNIYKTLMLNKC
jgi:hypothetical protein